MKPTIREIDHVVLRVADLATMRRFYCEVLGCTVEREVPESGLLQLRAGRSMIDLVAAGKRVPRSAVAPGRNMDHLCLRVEPYDGAALCQWLTEHGVEVDPEVRRYGAEGFGQSMYLLDPEGNTVELKGPPETSAPATV